MTKKEYLMEQLESNKYHISDDGYSVIESMIDDYDWEDEDDFRENLYEVSGEQFMYYADAFDYIKEQWITDFKDAFDNGYGENVCSIATYYLEEEINTFLYDYIDFSGLEECEEEGDEE